MNLLYDAGTSNPVLCDTVGGEMKKEVQEGADICTPVADSC